MSNPELFDYVVIGSGFGGSVSAMRLTEKGYRVLVLEQGKRFKDEDFPKTNWNLPRYLWMPKLKMFGIQQMTFLRHLFVLHGAGVGGGSLVYATVLMEPDDKLFSAPGWNDLTDWKSILRPHFDTAKRMLGVATNPCPSAVDPVLKEIATEIGYGETFRPSQVGIYFGQPGQTLPDPFFDGEGPDRTGCIHCGACMVGCRHNAKNTLVKNYLYFAEKWGAQIRAEAQVRDIRPLPDGQADGARYDVIYQPSTTWFGKPTTIRAKNVIISAGVLGSMRLLFRCRDVTQSLPKISQQLGNEVRTNSEALMGVTTRKFEQDYSQGIAITSVFQADEHTQIEPVRYPTGASFMRNLASPLLTEGGNFFTRLIKMIIGFFLRPLDFFNVRFAPRWAERSTILLVMQTQDNMIRLRLGRSFMTLFRRDIISKRDDTSPLIAELGIAHRVTRALAQKINGIPQGTLHEVLFGVPSTAHLLGGCKMGRTDADGVVDVNCQVHNYPGLYVIDGSIMPANPGINPSLTITALAEYAMSKIGRKKS